MRNKSKKLNSNTVSTKKPLSKDKNESSSGKEMKTSNVEKNPVNPDGATSDQREILESFNLELKWCLHQLENELSSKDKKNIKKAEEMNRCYRILNNSKHPMVKKRQAMRSYFGDYRGKMEKEAQKFKFGSVKVNNSSKAPTSSLFLKKSVPVHLETASGDCEHKINFGEGNKNKFLFNFSIEND